MLGKKFFSIRTIQSTASRLLLFAFITLFVLLLVSVKDKSIFNFLQRSVSLGASTLGTGDVNSDGKVDVNDIITVLQSWGNTATTNLDQYGDGKVNVFDFAHTANMQPTPTSVPSTGEWTQFGQNAQRTSYTSQSVVTPWKYKWQWNGADANGKQQAGHLSVPDLVQPVTGGNRVYMVAGNSVYALDKNTGSVLWTRGSIGTLSSTPVYDQESLYVASGNNSLYKLNASTGAVLSSFNAGTALNLAPLLANGRLYAGGANGNLYAVNPSTMSQVWVYSGGSVSATPPSYSSSRNIVVYNTQDLYVHAVNVADGTRKWRVKPTSRSYQSGTPTSTGGQAEEGWPVIAEQHGIVFVRYRLDWDTLWTWNPYPTTLSAIRTNLQSRPDVQALFALSLDTGTQAFLPLAGNGGAGDGGTLPMGPQPVIRNIGGQEVAYIIWRNGLTCAGGWCDGREDATMGEMVLDNTTVSGYQAGDVRFVRFTDIQTDEMMNITMANDTIFHSHWLINSAEKITDRSAARGGSFTNPITTTDAPFIIWRQCNGTNTCNYPGCTGNTVCGINCAPSTSRYCSQGLYSYGDARSYPPGFYEYNNDMNSGTTPFTVVSSGLVLVKTNDGGVIALENGNPTAGIKTSDNLALNNQNNPLVLGAHNESWPYYITHHTIPLISYTDAGKYFGRIISAEGTIASAVDHLPKAIYLGFKDPHDGALLVRIFDKDVKKFNYDLMKLKGRKVKVTGLVTYYWPDSQDPEIIVTDPSQIEVIQ